MFLDFDFQTLDKLSDGVVLVDRYGQVTDFNDAAKPWVSICMNAAERLARLIAGVQRNHTSLPMCVDLFEQTDAETQPEPGPVLPDVHLCSDGKDGYALLFTLAQWPEPVTAVQSQGVLQPHLIGDELRHELSEVIGEISALRVHTGAVQLQGLRRHARHLRAMFTSIDEVSRLADTHSMVPGERTSVLDLLEDTVARLAFHQREYSIQASCDRPAESLGLVYGNAKWLRCALTGLLESLEDGNPRRCRIALKVGQNADFLVLSARPEPEWDAPVSTTDVPGAATIAVPRDEFAGLRLASSVRVPLARRIVEMHGGQLDVLQAGPEKSNGGITGFTLQLPTGGPVNQRSKACENCLVNQQAALYARDLAALMPAFSRDAEVSDAERCMLLGIPDKKAGLAPP